MVKLLEGHNVNLKKLTDVGYTSNYFVDYRADVEDPLAMLYQSGYLTIKSYDKEYEEFGLDFPNDEVRSSFVTLMANSYFGKKVEEQDSRKIHKIGVNISSESRTVDEWMAE